MRIFVPMYEKGRSFVMAGGLVKAHEGHRFVYLHLLCQGFENIGKALLLAHDYEKYWPMLQPVYSHDLESILAEVNVVYGKPFFSKNASADIQLLNNFYKRHRFRYGDQIDFANNSSDIQANHMHRELVDHLDALNQKFSN